MKITRLDKIIENNVTYSTQKGNQDQIIYILQDISTTLAMIYDRMCGEEPVSESSESVTTMAFVIPFDKLQYYETMHFESVEFAEGYDVKFIGYFEDRNDMENRISVAVKAFGENMRLNGKQYGKKWRCWNVKPTKEEREKTKWIK